MTAEFKSELLERLWFHHPMDEWERQVLVKIINLAGSGKDIFDRKSDVHITSRAFVFNKDLSKVLLHIRKNGYITTLGGHIEPKTDVYCIDAALREAREESGKKDINILNDGKIFELIEVRSGKSEETRHMHYNIIFSLIADSEDLGKPTEGTVKWYTFDEFKRIANNKEIKAIYNDPQFERAIPRWKLLKAKQDKNN